MKKTVLSTLALSLALAVPSSVFADNAPEATPQEPTNSVEVTPRVVVLPDQVFTLTNGEGNIPFRYQGSAAARIYLKNEGTKSISYRIKFPGDNRELLFSTIEAGKAETWNFPLWEVYGTISQGLWNIYAYSSDGSTQKLRVSVRTLE